MYTEVFDVTIHAVETHSYTVLSLSVFVPFQCLQQMDLDDKMSIRFLQT